MLSLYFTFLLSRIYFYYMSYILYHALELLSELCTSFISWLDIYFPEDLEDFCPTYYGAGVDEGCSQEPKEEPVIPEETVADP